MSYSYDNRYHIANRIRIAYMLTHYLIVETIKFDVFMIDMLISTREVNLIEKSGIVGFIDTKDA